MFQQQVDVFTTEAYSVVARKISLR